MDSIAQLVSQFTDGKGSFESVRQWDAFATAAVERGVAEAADLERLSEAYRVAGARSKHGGPLSWDNDIWPSLCELLGGSVAALWDATARFDEELAGVLAEARSAPRSAALEQLRAATARHTQAAATAVPFEVSVTLLDPARDPTAAAAASGRYLLLREMALSPRTADPLGAGVVAGGAGSGVALVSESVRGRSVGMLVRKHGPMLPADPLARSVMAEALGWAIDVVDQCRGRLRLPSAAEDLFVVADEGMRVAAVGAELEAWPVSGCSEGAALRDCNLSTAVGACSALLQVLIAEPSPPRRGATDGEKVRDAPSRELHLNCSDPAEGGAAAGGAPRLPDTLWLCQGDRLVLRGAATASTVAGNGAALRVVGGAGEEEGPLVLVGAAPGAVSVAIRESAGAEPAILRVQVVPLAAGRWVSMAASALRTGEERLLRAVAAFLQADMPELDDVADAYHAWLARQPAGE
ncbi:hypothetical protein FNF27_01064 [Cafeteria roenbergensis]|uniref:Uncharacterized protein n=2 Tax=Cafeteria roenbergensis TaxID=33653 RepID=A0A5A8EHC9_CAFRO|nr:hypothetical protein FNF27_01064 [Cafeteria roenbergensis]